MNKKFTIKLAAVAAAFALAVSGTSVAFAANVTAAPVTATPAVVLPSSYQVIVDNYVAKVNAYKDAKISYASATSFKQAGEMFRSAMKTWQALQKQNVAAKKAIAKQFKLDLVAAKTAYDAAIKAATTDADKLAAENAKKLAIATATSARKAALKLITKIPAQPVAPKKSAYKSASKATPSPSATADSSDGGKGKGKGKK